MSDQTPRIPDPFEGYPKDLDQPADAAELGDVEALRRQHNDDVQNLAQEARRSSRLLHERNSAVDERAEMRRALDASLAARQTAERERDALRADIRAITADPMLDEGMMLDAVNARLDREPGREEPDAHVDLTPPGPHRLLSAAELDEMASNTLAGETKTEPAPAPRTLLGWTVPDDVRVKPDGDMVRLICGHCAVVYDAFQDNVESIADFLQAHSHGHVVEQQPEANRD